MQNNYPAIVVGAGQAGLATSFHLKKQGVEHIVLEAQQIANSWHQRWDSFRLVTPNWMNNLPGAEYDGDKPDEFLTKHEVLEYFNSYALKHKLPIYQGVTVTSITKNEATGIFTLLTNICSFKTAAVVVCCGLFQKAYIPDITNNISPQIKQLHSSHYKSPNNLNGGNVLIIGSGLSGMQIAKEINHITDKKVYFSLSKVARIPVIYRGQLVSHWLRAMGVHELITGIENDKQGASANYSFDHQVGVIGGGNTINIKELISDGVIVAGRTKQINGTVIDFKDDLIDSLEYANLSYESYLARIDQYITANNIQAPLEKIDLNDYQSLNTQNSLTLDVHESNITNIIWATGYQYNFNWIKLPAFNTLGQPRAFKGTSDIEGLYFCGMPNLYKNKSGFIGGVGELAKIITQNISTLLARQ